MYFRSRTILLLAICALAAAVAIPSAALAQVPADETYLVQSQSPSDETYVVDEPSAGSPAGDDGGSSGLPILLVILAGTALAGASIAIMRKQKSD